MTFGLQTPRDARLAPSGLVFWPPLEEARRRFGLEREQLTEAVGRGELSMRAKVVGGAVRATVSSRDLVRLFGQPLERAASTERDRPEPESPSTPPQHDRSAELDELHGRLVAAEDLARVLELDRARLEGRLETADRIERGLQRYADKLEDRLETTRVDYEGRLAEAESLRLNLARVVGRMETELLRLQAKVEAYEAGDGPALLGEGGGIREAAPRRRERPAKKRRWFRRG
mgnify:CR=1 FL=1